MSNPILEEYAKKYTPEELTEDGIPTIETQLKEIREKDEKILLKYLEEDKDRYNREMKQRVKCLALKKMGKSIFTNTFTMTKFDREVLQEYMWEFNDYEHVDIINQFNKLISREVLDNPDFDYSKVPIYEWK
jgi:hypothetical protein